MTPRTDGGVNGSQSLYLDLLRSLAALAVLLHHYSNHIVKLPHRVFPDVGQEAVMMFFVLSGFVIAMIAEKRERDFVIFVVKRLARFWSVVAPAAVLLIVVYLATIVLDSSAYEGWGNLQNWPAKTAAMLTFTTDNALWQDLYLPGGKPMWSLSYEFWYYLLFAFCVLLPNRFVGFGMALIIAAFLGLPGLLLLPVWALGVGTFHLFKARPLSRPMAWIFSLGGFAGFVVLQTSGLRESLLNTNVIFHRSLAHATSFPYFYFSAFCVALHLLGALNLLAGEGRPWPRFFASAVRRTAHTAFFLYLTHIPVMLCLKALFNGLVFPFLLPFLAWIFALVVGRPVENLRFPLQRALRSLANKLNPRPGPALN